MRLRFVLPAASMRLLAALSLAMPVAFGPSPVPAIACSGDGPRPPVERFAPPATGEELDQTGLVVLVEVLDEASFDAQPSVFLSNVEVKVRLRGEDLSPILRVGPHGFGAPDCSGGPRLLPGEKVLLFLQPSRGILPNQAPGRYGDWQSGQFGTPILFDGGEAYYLSWARFSQQGNGKDKEQREHVGKAEDVLSMALSYFAATQAQRSRLTSLR